MMPHVVLDSDDEDEGIVEVQVNGGSQHSEALTQENMEHIASPILVPQQDVRNEICIEQNSLSEAELATHSQKKGLRSTRNSKTEPSEVSLSNQSPSVSKRRKASAPAPGSDLAYSTLSRRSISTDPMVAQCYDTAVSDNALGSERVFNEEIGSARSLRTRNKFPVVEIDNRTMKTQNGLDESPRPTKRRKIDSTVDIDELSSDFHKPLPPKDLYKPRSSRSRSSQVPAPGLEKEIDNTSKSVRRRKSASHAFESNVKDLEDMGFRSSQAEKAMMAMHGDVARAAEWLADCGENNDTIVVERREMLVEANEQNPQSDRRGSRRRTSQRFLLDDVEDGREVEENLDVEKEGEDNHDHDHDHDHDHNDDDNYDGNDVIEVKPKREPTPKSNTKKRGRGRPKKPRTQPDEQELPAEEGEENLPCAELIVEMADNSQEHISVSQKDALGETNGNAQRPPEEDAKAETPDIQSNVEENAVLSKQDKSASPIRKHSPLNKGKMAHRVGLSKRVQIEPLLKIRKKA